MHFATILLDAGAAEPTAGNIFGSIAPFLLVLVFFYFFIYKQNKDQQKALAQQRSGLKKGDHVVTSGGIMGKVVSVKTTTDKKGRVVPVSFTISLKPAHATEIVVAAEHVFADSAEAQAQAK